ncbi:MAG: ribosome maturation factor RimM [Cellvibrionaceae bacterium]|nr:ribosome maturation factor RimM [Cellvibrionaceae bacterium]
MAKPSELLTVGRVVGVFGIKGWVKVKSYTQPESAIISYQPWQLQSVNDLRPVVVADHQFSDKGLLVRFEGVQDRTLAESYTRCDVLVIKALLPTLGAEDFYWHQLIGLAVIYVGGSEHVKLGEVQGLLETGANDVLVVKPCEGSVDQQERLVPYVFGRFVLGVDLQQRRIEVDWDPEY